VNIIALENALQYHFHNRELLRLALTHPSCGPENNQRLEFLGDAVLQLAMSDIVYANHPEQEEGGMTFLRARMVREETLCEVARHLNLGQYLRMDHGCEITGGRARPAVLADAMEAVLAAVYLDAGFETAAGLVRTLWPREQEVSMPVTDNKTALQELLQGQGLPSPEYQTLAEEGPAHLRVFTVAVYTQGQEAGRGQGNSKKRAEQAAAGEALKRLRAAEENK
jgi:ribonuclease III